MEHHFDIDIATDYGLAEAVLLNNLWFWVQKNEANEVHYHDGEYWTYNSVRALETLHPYLTAKKIRTALSHLKDEGIILTGNYNKSPYDKTAWYAFSKKGKSIMTKCQIEDAEKSNGDCPKVEPIPDINTDIKPHIKNTYTGEKPPKKKKQGNLHNDPSLRPTLDEVEAYISEKGLNVNGKTFFDFFDAGEWVDSKGNPVQNWKQKLITWSKNDNRGSNTERKGVRGTVRAREVSQRDGTPEWYKPFKPYPIDE